MEEYFFSSSLYDQINRTSAKWEVKMGLKFPCCCLEEPSCTVLFVFHSEVQLQSILERWAKAQAAPRSLTDNSAVGLENSLGNVGVFF